LSTTATAMPPSALERLASLRPDGTPQNTNDNRPRWLVQTGLAVLRVDTDAVAGRFLTRGEITPCTGYPCYDRKESIPQEMRIPGSERTNRTGTEMLYMRYAGPEAERLLNELEQQNPEGLTEITALLGWEPAEVAALRLNDVIYPQGLARLPEQHDDLLAHYKQIREGIAQGGTPPCFTTPAQKDEFGRNRGLYLQIIDTLIGATERVRGLHLAHLEFTHQCMRLQPSDPSGYYKRGYDEKDQELLVRTGKPRIDNAQDMTAKALNTLADGAAKGGNAELLQLIAEQQAVNRALLEEIKALKTEKGEPKPAPQPQGQKPQGSK